MGFTALGGGAQTLLWPSSCGPPGRSVGCRSRAPHCGGAPSGELVRENELTRWGPEGTALPTDGTERAKRHARRKCGDQEAPWPWGVWWWACLKGREPGPRQGCPPREQGGAPGGPDGTCVAGHWGRACKVTLTRCGDGLRGAGQGAGTVSRVLTWPAPWEGLAAGSVPGAESMLNKQFWGFFSMRKHS